MEREHRRTLDRILDRRAAKRMKTVYDQAHAELESKLRSTVRGKQKETFTSSQRQLFQALIEDGQQRLTQKLTRELDQVTHEAAVEGVSLSNESIMRLTKDFDGIEIVPPTEEAARLAGVLQGRRRSLLRQNKTSMTNYGGRLVTRMEDELSQSLLQGEPNSLAIDRVAEVADVEWWQAERIVRTESAFAFNATARDGMLEAAEEIDDMQLRWSEHVSDEDFEPLDDRVAPDSMAMHGQVAKPGAPFYMPTNASDVGASMRGQSWDFPPNRPNDRAVLTPWRPGWGIPAWSYASGKKLWLTRQG